MQVVTVSWFVCLEISGLRSGEDEKFPDGTKNSLELRVPVAVDSANLKQAIKR